MRSTPSSARQGICSALNVVAIFLLAGMMIVGSAVPKLDQIDQARAVIDQNSDPRRYENPTYGMRLLIPSTWDIDP